MIQNSTLLDQTSRKHAIEILLGTLHITNGTFISNQDYAIYCVYSTLDMSNVILDQIQSSEDII